MRKTSRLEKGSATIAQPLVGKEENFIVPEVGVLTTSTVGSVRQISVKCGIRLSGFVLHREGAEEALLDIGNQM